jgi:Zn-dependent protease
MPDFDTGYFLGALLAFVFGTAFARGCQAFMAYRLGDKLPRNEGRMTFNPARHHEPLGLLLALFISLRLGFIAWGKPLNLNPYSNKMRRLGGVVIGLTGLFAYFILAAASGLLFNLLLNFGTTNPENLSLWIKTAYYFTYFNALFLAFNLIPIPPLDCYLILKGLLSPEWEVKLLWLETYGPVLLLTLVIILQFLFPSNILYTFVFTPIVRLIMTILGLPV